MIFHNQTHSFFSRTPQLLADFEKFLSLKCFLATDFSMNLNKEHYMDL